MNTQLAICIPTYNRAEFLRECLEAFLPQVEPHQIPIHVSDNGSTDHTLAMLEEFSRNRYPLLTYRSNNENRGIDQNMVDVLAMASSKYGWLFGDDDLPATGAICTVLKYLDRDFKLIVVNASTHNADFSQQVEERRVRLFEDRIYSPGDHDRLMVDTASYITYLGGLVVDLTSWRSIDHKPFLNTDYLHVSVVLRYVVGSRAAFCAEPVARIRLQPPSWVSRSFEVEMINWPRTVWGAPVEHYSDAAKQSVCDEYPTRSIRRILAARAYGRFDRETYADYIRTQSSVSAMTKFVMRLAATLPRPWLRNAFIAYIHACRISESNKHELALFRLQASTYSRKRAD